MNARSIPLYAGNARSRRCDGLRLTERSKLILGTALVLFELVAAAGLFGWLDGQNEKLNAKNINLSQMVESK